MRSRFRSASSKAVRDGSRFDTVTSAHRHLRLRRSRASCSPSCWWCCSAAARSGRSSRCAGSPPTISPTFDWPQKILDYLWHITLPVTSLVLGSFATSTLLTKNSFLDEIKKSYVQTARMKGLTERRVLYGHVFRNAMLIVIAGFPGRLHRRLLYRLAADRAGVLARRARLSLLRIAHQSRLPGRARQSLYLRAASGWS